MLTNTYGHKMIGLKKASGNTINYGFYSGLYNELFYNMETGEIWTVLQCSFGHNSWTEYRDKNIIKICDTSKHMSMQEIADAINECLEWHIGNDL